ncbi:DUF655 domain-containing protein [Acidianus sulfidivorans JP7]|uniref:DUF655 domain-containing protein n=1 Tax=Acidianus sulfidivorans JP7 TaxID=619593 RepID=A0A2U9IQM8_9CREN|nr:DUF655 domain-containing protein [Acidianus sulfidivorans]AWR98267.1 DUF655 domain-containing protein [Acidianus sulfidivorans JP7]
MQRKRPRERFVYVLDYMKEGNPLDKHRMHKNRPIAQLLGYDYFILMEGSVNGLDLQIEDKIDLDDKKFNIRIDFTISFDDLTSVAKDTLNRVLKKIILERENVFVEFFNKSEPLTLKLHALELLPGIGKKTLRIILDERKKKPFESFKDIEDRTGIKNIPDILLNRIMIEIMRKDKYYLFVYPTELDHTRELEHARESDYVRKPQEQYIYIGYLEKLRQSS